MDGIKFEYEYYNDRKEVNLSDAFKEQYEAEYKQKIALKYGDRLIKPFTVRVVFNILQMK